MGVGLWICCRGISLAMGKPRSESTSCPCGNSDSYSHCCGRYVDGSENAPSPEALMRSRYSAYTLSNSSYLLNTWHESTRPGVLVLENDNTQWNGLTIVSAESPTEADAEGIVEFIARYKVNGKAGELYERSRFIKENERWYYINGDIIG